MLICSISADFAKQLHGLVLKKGLLRKKTVLQSKVASFFAKFWPKIDFAVKNNYFYHIKLFFYYFYRNVYAFI